MNRRTRNLLRIEHLESRDLLAVIRLAAWNTLNNPNDIVGDADYETVLAAIENETVAGNTKRVDILALQETDLPGSGDDSIGRIANVLDLLYPTTDYASVVSSTDGGGDSTGFVYDTSTVSLLSSVEVAAETLTHTILRGEFRPVDSFGENDFFVYSVHLKSGATGSDEAIRGAEAALLRNDADLLGEGTPVLFVGDFNMQDSFEPAWTNLTASGSAQVQDVANAPGSWSDNIAFKSLHSQNPRNAMDDRFDLHFASGEFYDGVGIEYVENSYRVFGNNGTHTLDAGIATGTGANPAVLTALANASDHLPVIADYETIPSVPFVRIRETGNHTRVIEGGIYDTYNVVLDTVPTANVTVTVSPDAQLGTAPTQLVFTPANALTPQTVVVSAFDDASGEGNHSGLITHSVASADVDYNGLSVMNVSVAIVDDDNPTIFINEVDSDTEGIDGLEFVELYDGGVGNASLTDKVLVFFDGSTDEAYLRFSWSGNNNTNGDGFHVVGNSNVENVDFAFFNVNRIQNGADAVALYDDSNGTAPSIGDSVTTVGLLDAVVYGTDDAPDLGLLALLQPGQSQLNENENGNKDFESLSRVPDGGAPRLTSQFDAQLPSPGELNTPPTPGVLILQSGTRVDVEEGGVVDSYQLALDTIPSQPVSIAVDPDEQTDLGAGPGVAIVLEFTVENALIPQTVFVAAVDDSELEDDHASVITHTSTSSDLGYNGLTIGNVVASVIDNEVAIPPSIVISEIMYNPDSEESEPGIGEWIEIVNTGSESTDIGRWRFSDEDAATWGEIPAGTTLLPNQAAVLFDEEFADAATFRSEWSVPTELIVIGIPWGNLANSPSDENEILELKDDLGLPMDQVNFDDANGWPSDNPDGASIYLIDLLADNNVGSNWSRSSIGVDAAVSAVGPTFSTSDVGSPGFVPVSADFDGDQDVDGFDFLVWQRGFSVHYGSEDLSNWESTYGGGAATIGAADFDGNQGVDGFDFLLWQRGFGALSAAKVNGDANDDLMVDAQDLAIWSSSYSSGSSFASQNRELNLQAATYLAEIEKLSGEDTEAGTLDAAFEQLAFNTL